ncbi:MAG: hypothetical protein JWQ74_649 [Marmoricola sp.]|nr:hypothetical protein [Marmoricola sp.]
MKGLLFWDGGRRWLLPRLAALTAAGLVVLFAFGASWVGSWKMALDQATGSLALLGPAASGMAAWTYARLRDQLWDQYVAGTRRGIRGLLAPWAGVTLVGAGALALCVVIAVGAAQASGSRPVPHTLGMLLQPVAALACLTAFGALLGSRLQGWAAAPLAAAGSFLLGALSVGGTLPGIFRTGGVTGPLAGETFDRRVLITQTLVLVALTAVALLGLAGPGARRWSSWVVAAAAVGVVIAGWADLERHGYERYRPEAGVPALRCAGSRPAVCLSVDTTRPLAALAAEAARQAVALRAIGVDVPARLVDVRVLRAASPGAAVLNLVDDESLVRRASTTTVARALATPRECPAYSAARPPETALIARGVLADWIASRAGADASPSDPAPAEVQWLARPVAEQSAWVRETYRRLSTCDLAELTVPYPR